VCYCLCVGRYAIVLSGGEKDGFRFEAGEDALDELEGGIGCAMLDQHERLASWVDAWAVKGVAGDDGDIRREVVLKRGDLRRLARGLATDDGILLG